MERKTRVNLTYYIVLIALVLVSILVHCISDYVSSNQMDIIFSMLTQVVCMFILPIVLYFIFIKPKSNFNDLKEDFGFKPFKKGELSKVILLGILAIFLNTVFADVNYGFLNLVGYKYPHSASSDYRANIGLFFLDLFMTGMLPALCEETAHRGLFRLSYKDKPVQYILISSLLFALMHQNIAQVIYTFFTGIMFASAVVFTGNIKASMIMHFMVNAVEVIGSLGIQLNSVILAIKPVFFNLLYSSVFGKIVLVVLTILALYLFVKTLYSFKSSEKFSFQKTKRMFLDGTLTVGYETSKKATTMANVLFIAIIVVGIMSEVFTLIWGVIR